MFLFFFFSSRRRHTRYWRDWSSDVCSSDLIEECPWATMGRVGGRTPNILTSLELKSEVMEQRNLALQRKYQQIKENEVRYETQQMDDADYVIVAFGSAARIAEKGRSEEHTSELQSR